jgi:PPOX class probable F420-dependent enzyme
MDQGEARSRFAGARAARLATAGADGRPHLVPVVFALDGDTLYSAVDDVKPKASIIRLRRLRNIADNPAVALLADHYDDDWAALWWVRADGTARLLDPGEAEAARARGLLAERYPQYRDAPPPGVVIAVDVARWSGWAAGGVVRRSAPAAERDVRLADGRVLRTYDSAPSAGPADAFTVVWHHGSPQTGVPLEPLLEAAAERGIRLITYGRPSYGGSTPFPGRDVASAAGDLAQVADALGVGRFAVMGASGGGPHALACAALLGDRVSGAVSVAGLAPFTDEFDWFAGMIAPEALRAARDGRDARARFAETEEFDPESFTEADWAALRSRWQSLGEDAMRAGEAGPDGLVDDDVAFAAAWGFELTAIAAPVLVVHGGGDRVVPPAHADWLVRHLPRPELWLRPRDGHVSVLDACPVALDWLAAHRAAAA